MMDENELAREISNAVADKPRPQAHLRPVPATNNAVINATNEDTGRATHTMTEQMQKIITGIERDIAEANEVRMLVIRRINNLQQALEASRAAMEVLKT